VNSYSGYLGLWLRAVHANRHGARLRFRFSIRCPLIEVGRAGVIESPTFTEISRSHNKRSLRKLPQGVRAGALARFVLE
jgi:hypothetical protein